MSMNSEMRAIAAQVYNFAEKYGVALSIIKCLDMPAMVTYSEKGKVSTIKYGSNDDPIVYDGFARVRVDFEGDIIYVDGYCVRNEVLTEKEIVDAFGELRLQNKNAEVLILFNVHDVEVSSELYPEFASIFTVEQESVLKANYFKDEEECQEFMQDIMDNVIDDVEIEEEVEV